MGNAFKAAIAVWLLSCGAGVAADYPERPVHLIVPFAPGGVTDLAARVIGQQLSAKWGQQVVIENKPGAGGVIGVETAIRAAPDGYTILMATDGEIAIYPAIAAKPRFDSQKDLTPIARVTSTPMVWAANANAGITSLPDLVAAAKAKPGNLAYSSAGNGSSNHMATVRFAAAAGLTLLHVPYKGGAPASTAIAAGEVPVGMLALSSLLPFIDSGRIRPLAVASPRRANLLPNVPTVIETGVLPDFEASIWTGLFAPNEIPAPIAARIQADVLEALKDSSVVTRLGSAGAEAVGFPGAELRGLIETEIIHLSKTAKDAGIRLD